MMTNRQVMQQALVTLENVNPSLVCEMAHHVKKDQHGVGQKCPLEIMHLETITAIKAALAQPPQPVQEPVGEVTEVSDNGFKCEFNWRLAVGTKLYIAPPLLEQEPVACRFCHSKKGCWTWQCYNCGEIDDVQKPASPAAQPAPAPMSQPNRLIAYAAASKLQELGYEWVNDAWQQALAAPAPQRPWVGLTDEEIAQGNKESWVTEEAWQSAVWWAEAKLKEKNNG